MKSKIQINLIVFTAFFAGVFLIFPVISYAQLNVNPPSIQAGGSADLFWTAPSGFSFCSISSDPLDYNKNRASLGGITTVSPARTTTYYLTCTKVTHPRDDFEDQVTLTVRGGSIPAPSPTITPIPTSTSTTSFFDEFVTAGCAVSNTTAKVGESITFIGAGSGGVLPYSFSWSGDVSGSGSSIIRSFNTSGFKSAKVTVTDRNKDSDFAFCGITIVSGQDAADDFNNDVGLVDDNSDGKIVDKNADADLGGLTAGAGASSRNSIIVWLLILLLAGNLVALIFCVTKSKREKDKMDNESEDKKNTDDGNSRSSPDNHSQFISGDKSLNFKNKETPEDRFPKFSSSDESSKI